MNVIIMNIIIIFDSKSWNWLRQCGLLQNAQFVPPILIQYLFLTIVSIFFCSSDFLHLHFSSKNWDMNFWRLLLNGVVYLKVLIFPLNSSVLQLKGKVFINFKYVGLDLLYFFWRWKLFDLNFWVQNWRMIFNDSVWHCYQLILCYFIFNRLVFNRWHFWCLYSWTVYSLTIPKIRIDRKHPWISIFIWFSWFIEELLAFLFEVLPIGNLQKHLLCSIQEK